MIASGLIFGFSCLKYKGNCSFGGMTAQPETGAPEMVSKYMWKSTYGGLFHTPLASTTKVILMNWNTTKLGRPPGAKQRRSRNRRVEHLNREIRELRAFLRTAAPRISEILMNGAREEEPMESPGTSSANSGAQITDLADLAHRLTVQTTELRLEFATLDSGFKECGQAFVELLEEVADRLDTLVTPARYRR